MPAPDVTPPPESRSAARTFTAIVNPAAGGGARSAAATLLMPLARALRDAGARVDVQYSRDLPHAVALARTAAATRGPDHVVLGVGGDGMVGAVGGAIAGTEAVFGIVPAGRGNDFARQVGMPTDPEALARLLLSGEPRPVDTIRANGLAVLGSVYAGVDAVANLNANASRLHGSAAYYMGALRAVAGWRPVGYRVTVDGVTYERRGFTVVVANSGFYGFGRKIVPTAAVDDGILDILIIRHGPKSMFFSVMRELEDGSHVRRPEVEVLRGTSVRIEADRSLPYGADGEVDGVLPVTAEVMPAALRLIRP